MDAVTVLKTPLFVGVVELPTGFSAFFLVEKEKPSGPIGPGITSNPNKRPHVEESLRISWVKGAIVILWVE
jgi:hypothetical protein